MQGLNGQRGLCQASITQLENPIGIFTSKESCGEQTDSHFSRDSRLLRLDSIPEDCTPMKPFRKDTNMQYKSMVLELLRQKPEKCEQCYQNRMPLLHLVRVAAQLKSRHQAWQVRLRQQKPNNDRSQISWRGDASQFLQELDDSLPSDFPDESEPLTLGEAMAFIRRYAPPF